MRTVRVTAALAVAAALLLAGCQNVAPTARESAEPSASQSPVLASGEPGYHQEIALGERAYDLYAPPDYDKSVATAAVLVFHGRPGSPASIREQSNMDTQAEEAGFLAVYPIGLPGGWKPDPGDTTDVDYVAELIAALIADWNADPERIFVAGMSNGADMALAAGASLPDLIAGTAAVAPSDTVRVDGVVAGMDTPAPLIGLLGAQDGRFELGRDLIARWRENSDCDGEETQEGASLSTQTWQCGAGTTVVVHTVHDGGHEWFGSPDEPEPIWASAVIWEFFGDLS